MGLIEQMKFKLCGHILTYTERKISDWWRQRCLEWLKEIGR